MQSLFGLEGKRFLVIGGGQGMGEATARLLAQLGSEVGIADIELSRAQNVANEIEKSGARALPVHMDVTDDEALVAGLSDAENQLGPLDGMASVVGMAAWSSVIDMKLETWDLDHRRNLRYFFLAAREVAKSLKRRNAPGSIVGVASVDGIRSAPGHASYGAAKAGLISLAKTMAHEWGDDGIRVNIVAPGAIVTPRIPLMDAEMEKTAMSGLPIKRRGTVDDIAKAIAFFLSDMSPYVTGQTLAVDGGYTAVGLFGQIPEQVGDQGTIGLDSE